MKRILLLVSLGLLISRPILAQTTPPAADSAVAAPTTTWAHTRSDIPVDPAVTWGQLPNGLRYAILPNSEPKERVSIHLLVDTGSLMETEAQRGLAHFIEHMGFRGTKHFPPGELIKFFQRIGMAFGPDTNASTGFNSTQYQVELPKNDTSSLTEAFKALRDYADGVLFEPKIIDDERGVITAEKRERDSAQYRAMEAEFSFLLPDSLIPQRLPIGKLEVVQQAPREQFLEYYQTWYRPERMSVIVVGPVEASAVAKLITEAFADMKATAPARPEPTLGRAEMPTTTRAMVHRDPELPRISVSIETIAPYVEEPDTAANRLKLLPRALAYEMLNRRFQELVKKEDAPFTAAMANTSDFLKFATESCLEIQTGKPEQWQQALALAEQELRRALQYGFQEAELREVTSIMATDLDNGVQQASTRRSPALAIELMSSIKEETVFEHPTATRDLYRPALEKITTNDCLGALRVAWSAQTRLIFVAGNLPQDVDEAAVVAAFTTSSKVAVSATAAIKALTWGYTDFGKPGAITGRREIADLGITQVDFANGVTLNLKKTDFQAATIGLSARIGGGMLTMPANKPGLDIFTNAVSIHMGLGRHSSEDLKRILAGHTVTAPMAVAKDAFVILGKTTPTDLELELQLMAAQATDPGYRQEAQSLVQRTLGQYYNMLAHTPEGVYTLEIDRALAGGDNRFGMPAMETLLGYGMADVREWLSPALADGPIELSIVGDIDTEAAIGFVAKTFGALPARTAKPTYEAQRKVSYPAKGYEALRTVPTEIQRAQLYVFWPTTDSKDIALARRLNILADVLEDRIRLKLRDSLGGTYSPSTSHHASEVFTNYGFMMVQAGADPAETTKLLAAIRDVAETLRNGGITDDELERAKQPVLAKITETMRTNGYWLNTVMAACREQPRRLDWARTRKDDVAAITREEINQLAVRYLQPERLISYIVNPGPMTTPTPAAPEKPIRKRPTGGPAPDSTAPAESGTGESATGKKP